MQKKITAQAIREIAAASLSNEKTVKKVYAGKPCRFTSYERVRRTAEALSHPAPPEPADPAAKAGAK